MTLDEFKKQLATKHAGQFNLEEDGYIRHKFVGPEMLSRCPLAAIFGRDYIWEASRAGMQALDLDAIVDAADGKGSELRRWMLETLCT